MLLGKPLQEGIFMFLVSNFGEAFFELCCQKSFHLIQTNFLGIFMTTDYRFVYNFVPLSGIFSTCGVKTVLGVFNGTIETCFQQELKFFSLSIPSFGENCGLVLSERNENRKNSPVFTMNLRFNVSKPCSTSLDGKIKAKFFANKNYNFKLLGNERQLSEICCYKKYSRFELMYHVAEKKFTKICFRLCHTLGGKNSYWCGPRGMKPV